MSDLSDLLTSIIFGEQPERSLTSLIKKGGMSEALVFFNLQKKTQKVLKNMILVKFFEWITRFFWSKERMSDLLKEDERFAHSRCYHERPEQIAHGRSFDMSDLSNLFTVADLSWTI